MKQAVYRLSGQIIADFVPAAGHRPGLDRYRRAADPQYRQEETQLAICSEHALEHNSSFVFLAAILIFLAKDPFCCKISVNQLSLPDGSD